MGATNGEYPTAVTTLWFVSAAVPRDVLTAEPVADRGFARKYLAQLAVELPGEDIAAPVHIGDFDMNRSAPPGPGEFYIGGYPGLSVVQTVLPDLERLSDIPEPYLELIAAADVFATCHTPGDPMGLGGFAHWSGGTLKRAFSATRETVFEDTGLPEPFEAPFWEGNTDATGIQLRFIPGDMGEAAIEYWLGFRVAKDGFDVPVSAFAVDGRPAPRSRSTSRSTSRPQTEGRTSGRPTGAAAHAPAPDSPGSPGTPGAPGYDDYADAKAPSTRDTSELLKGAAGSVFTGIGRGIAGGARLLQTGAHKIGDEVRRRARNTGR